MLIVNGFNEQWPNRWICIDSNKMPASEHGFLVGSIEYLHPNFECVKNSYENDYLRDSENVK